MVSTNRQCPVESEHQSRKPAPELPLGRAPRQESVLANNEGYNEPQADSPSSSKPAIACRMSPTLVCKLLNGEGCETRFAWTCKLIATPNLRDSRCAHVWILIEESTLWKAMKYCRTPSTD